MFMLKLSMFEDRTSEKPPFIDVDLRASERAKLLDKTQWSADFDWLQIETMVKYMRLKKAPKGTILFREGDAGSFMCIIIAGKVKIEKENESAKKKFITLIGPGQIIGELSLVEEQPRSASAAAEEDVTFLMLTREDFDRLASELPILGGKVLSRIIKLLGERLRRTSEILADFL